ncbi:MAG TPA: zf-HC2 domain-containing protein [Ktedonobacteraceae bacterium]|nr:zf-HC2 domain-containing protein [Ktedonobacteraceae bacterium]
MTQQEHLTTEQLSAFLDKQLTHQEQVFFDAHLQNCPRCQSALAQLRRTVVLLHAMPQPELPRSFTLPAASAPRQIPAARPQARPAQQGRLQHYTLRRAVRAVCTLAAVIGFLFIMSGLLANIPFGRGAAETASTPSFNGVTHTAPGAGTIPQEHATAPHALDTQIATGRQKATPVDKAVQPTPQPSSSIRAGRSSIEPTAPTLPPVLDLSQPTGRLSLGALLLLLSIVGILTTRRRSGRPRGSPLP